jgi:hypothetical protein
MHLVIECLFSNSNHPSLTQTIQKKINDLIEQHSASVTPPSSISRRLFKSAKLASLSGPPPAAPDSSLVADAANKLRSLAKSAGSTVNLSSVDGATAGCTLNTYKNDKYRLSSGHFDSAPIRFTSEDIELSDKESQLLHSLKSLKNPLTSTITLGRRFKRNVLKLSIFNSFSTSTSNLSGEKSSSKGDLKSDLKTVNGRDG